MDDTISNPLRFETNPYHNVIIKDRKIMEITGVKQIDSFDANEFLIETAQGWMLIQGKELKLGKLDTERGDVVIKGVIESMTYVTNKKGNGKESMITKIFK
ncbi:sporulation protein YabP [Erysipelotrichaceae bacterium HCN-30851]